MVGTVVVRQCARCLDWGVPRLREGLCWSCSNWLKHRPTRASCARCRRIGHVDGDGLCRPCVIATGEDIQSGDNAAFPGGAQLHL
ncbi:hypothetical protein [Streptomyces sp. NPDC058086]|uniref:hypothetical protein n=1 Tax=Streptomyces sp. NPDC058086 TaxID=3346334 RepID=UPI0036EC27B5